MQIKIRRFQKRNDRAQVMAIWKTVFGYSAPHNDPALAIDRKAAAKDGLLFVAARGKQVIGTVMAGYDGHRGWIYHLAVLPDYRTQGMGKVLMEHAESALKRLGCVKVNLQVLENNSGVVDFYRKLGYAVEPRISMGKILYYPPIA
jgi:ribosomal protein S18 acetylase RimI-like enzyme